MNPNTVHQVWSRWEYRIYSDHQPDYQTVKANCARFGRTLFGSVSAMRITQRTDGDGRLHWQIEVMTEGHPIQELLYVEWVHAQWRRFLLEGFGHTAEIRSHARLDAGERSDGLPADQLIILPPLIVRPDL